MRRNANSKSILVTQLYVRKGHNANSYEGHVFTLLHNVQNVANILPQSPENLSLIVFEVKGRNNSDSFFKVRQKKVNDAVVWLEQNSPFIRK